jgi:CRP-like cAMP-binding protein
MQAADTIPPALAAGSTVRQLAAGESLFNQGDRASAIYQVDSGRLCASCAAPATITS